MLLVRFRIFAAHGKSVCEMNCSLIEWAYEQDSDFIIRSAVFMCWLNSKTQKRRRATPPPPLPSNWRLCMLICLYIRFPYDEKKLTFSFHLYSYVMCYFWRIFFFDFNQDAGGWNYYKLIKFRYSLQGNFHLYNYFRFCAVMTSALNHFFLLRLLLIFDVINSWNCRLHFSAFKIHCIKRIHLTFKKKIKYQTTKNRFNGGIISLPINKRTCIIWIAEKWLCLH